MKKTVHTKTFVRDKLDEINLQLSPYFHASTNTINLFTFMHHKNNWYETESGTKIKKCKRCVQKVNVHHE